MDSNTKNMGKVAAYYAMIQLLPWEEAFYAVEDAAELAKEMGKRGYKLFRKGTGQAVGFMKPKIHNMGKFANKMRKHTAEGWVKIRPHVTKFANQTKNAINNYAPKAYNYTKSGFQKAKNATNNHIIPKIVKPSGNFLKDKAIQAKNIYIQHVWPNVIKPTADFIMTGAAFEAVMNGFWKLHDKMPWTKSTYDDYMFYDFYEIKESTAED